MKSCKSGFIINPATGRCVKTTGKIGISIAAGGPKSPSRQQKSPHPAAAIITHTTLRIIEVWKVRVNGKPVAVPGVIYDDGDIFYENLDPDHPDILHDEVIAPFVERITGIKLVGGDIIRLVNPGLDYRNAGVVSYLGNGTCTFFSDDSGHKMFHVNLDY